MSLLQTQIELMRENNNILTRIETNSLNNRGNIISNNNVSVRQSSLTREFQSAYA
jgi:FtsZ-binding cell division protein ZapB